MECQKHRLCRNMTLGQWLERTVCDLKNPKRLKPSSNYQVYVSLFNRLKEEGSIINLPVSKVNDSSYRRFISWLNRNKKPNYNGIMITFTALLNRARKARLTRYKPDFPFRDFAPKNRRQDSAMDFISSGGSIKSLTLSQYRDFLNLDLNSIKMSAGPHMEYWKELFRDFCVLLYELKSRPADILNLNSDNIATDPLTGKTTCVYIPQKKKNHNPKSSIVVQFLSDAAVNIVEKYRGTSKGSYIFPFRMNERKWNLNNPNQYREHYRLSCNTLSCINRFLHLVGKRLDLPFPLTLYTFRRSAITHAVIENRIPLPILAKMAGTSVTMIERHYTNYFHALADY